MDGSTLNYGHMLDERICIELVFLPSVLLEARERVKVWLAFLPSVFFGRRVTSSCPVFSWRRESG
jgi:hypothetical protein